MTSYDPDVLRWNLHLLDVCSISNAGSCSSVTQYGQDLSQVESVKEGYVEAEPPNVENDEVLAKALQEELSRLARQEASWKATSGMEQLQASVLSQDWISPSNRLCNPDEVTASYSSRKEEEQDNEVGNGVSCSTLEEKPYDEDDVMDTLHIADESALDGEVGKRLNQMVPIPHIPKVNGELPTTDEEVSDHQRLLSRLQLYDLVENRVQGDGNCQFRAISDQLYRSPDYHKFVRDEVVQQLKNHREIYDGYVPMAYADYLKKMSKSGEWGDHVTLQAAADSYGVKIFMLTSFRDTCYIEILPQVQKSDRVICLSFWAEVHYNSIYPEGELPMSDSRKKKKWWVF